MKVVSDEISSLEGVDKQADDLLVKVQRLSQSLASIRVWAQDDQETDNKITVSSFQHICTDVYSVLYPTAPDNKNKIH